MSDDDADEFRTWVARRKKTKKIKIDEIINAVGCDRERSPRWYHRVTRRGEPLAIADAVELATRMRLAGGRIPDAIVAKLHRHQPVLIVPEGESELAAIELVQQLGLGTHSLNSARRFFKQYERFSHTPTGEAIIYRLKTELGGDGNFRRMFGQMRRGTATTIDGQKVVATPSVLEIASEQYPLKRRRGNK